MFAGDPDVGNNTVSAFDADNAYAILLTTSAYEAEIANDDVNSVGGA